MNNGRAEYQFLWFIENYSLCWHKTKEHLSSPEFTIDGLVGTVFNMKLYPRAINDEGKGHISLYLNRVAVHNKPDDLTLNLELSVLAKDGSTLHSIYGKHLFARNESHGSKKFLQIDNVLSHRKDEFLPQDTLSVRCKVWLEKWNIEHVNEIVARTRIGIEQISFYHVTESFSALELNEKRTIEIRSPSKKQSVLSSSLYFTDYSSDENILMEITPVIVQQTLSECKLFLVDAFGEKIKCAEVDNRFDHSRKDIQNLTLSLTRQVILNNKSKYLPNDKLCLLCECIISTGVEYEKIEKVRYDKPFMVLNPMMNDVHKNDIYNGAQKLLACPNAMDDLKSIYNNQFLTDVHLKTKTNLFPAHKIWLCARSPVFKAMLTTDMREKISNSILVDDLEDDIVEQLLLFLYTDELENLQFESAVKLYNVGDKYQIEKLKVVCASFLIANVSTSSAIELLLLADTHSDSDLKKAVEDFILRHEEQVYGSEEWEKLAQTNHQLVTKTMLLKYKKN